MTNVKCHIVSWYKRHRISNTITNKRPSLGIVKSDINAIIIEVISKHSTVNCDLSIANALRRIMIAEVNHVYIFIFVYIFIY